MTEKEKFIDWFKKEQEKGLLYMIPFVNRDRLEGATEEDLYGELNRMVEAPDLPDPDVLGNYSPV